jgi:hypothetical protein
MQAKLFFIFYFLITLNFSLFAFDVTKIKTELKNYVKEKKWNKIIKKMNNLDTNTINENPLLLLTKGMAYFMLNQEEKATKDLERLVANPIIKKNIEYRISTLCTLINNYYRTNKIKKSRKLYNEIKVKKKLWHNRLSFGFLNTYLKNEKKLLSKEEYKKLFNEQCEKYKNNKFIYPFLLSRKYYKNVHKDYNKAEEIFNELKTNYTDSKFYKTVNNFRNRHINLKSQKIKQSPAKIYPNLKDKTDTNCNNCQNTKNTKTCGCSANKTKTQKSGCCEK